MSIKTVGGLAQIEFASADNERVASTLSQLFGSGTSEDRLTTVTR